MGRAKELIVNIGASTKELNKELGKARRSFNRNFAEIQKQGKSLSRNVSLPLAALAGTSVKVFADFEQGMAKVKAVSGATGAQFQKLSADAKRLGSETRFTATEVAGLQLEFSKLGFSTEETLNATEATLKLAQATDSDLARAAEVAGSTLRAFQMDTADTAHLTDVMAQSFSSSALDMEAFAQSMKFVAPVARAAGVSVEETTAMLGVLANAGIKGSQAGTALRRIFSELSNDGRPLQEQLQELGAAGLNLADAKDEVGRSAQSALLVLAEGAGKIQPFTKALQDSDGAASAMAATMDDTVTGRMKLMQSAIEGAQLAIGEALAPMVTDLAQRIQELGQFFTGLNDTQRTTIIRIGALAAAIGPGITMIAGLIKNLKLARSAYLLLNAAMLANPLTAIVTGVTLLAGAFLTLKANQKTAKEETLEFIGSIKALDKEQQILQMNQRKRELEEEKAALDRAARLMKAQAEVGTLGDKFDKQIARFNAGRYTEQVDSITESISELNMAIADATYGDGIVITVPTIEVEGGGTTGGGATGGQGASGGRGASGSRGVGIVPLKPLKANLREFETATQKATLKTRDYWQQYSDYVADEVMPGLTDKFNQLVNTINGFASSFGNAMAGVIMGTATAGQALKAFAIDAIKGVIAMAKANVIANATNPASPTNIATAGLATPALIVAGLTALEAFLGNIPSLAVGGLAASPALAMVGDHANRSAHNPEVIAPLDKLQGMMGGGHLSARVSGRDILLTTARDRNRSRRTYGSLSIQ